VRLVESRRTPLNVLPYRVTDPVLAVVPWDGTRLLDGTHDNLDLYPGLAAWWRTAEATWLQHRSSNRLDLISRVDYHHGLRDQFPPAPHRVVYTKSGMNLAAARVSDEKAVIDHTLYWAATATETEARYICAVLNSPVITNAVRPLQSRGESWRLPWRTTAGPVWGRTRMSSTGSPVSQSIRASGPVHTPSTGGAPPDARMRVDTHAAQRAW